MKKWILIVSCILPAFQITAQDLTVIGSLNSADKEIKYCAMLKDGKMMLMKENEVVTADITLKDGSRVSLEGTVKRMDGKKEILQNGDCIDEFGKLITKEKKTELNKKKPKEDYQK